MSIPYLVHKEDADRYDAKNAALEPFREGLRLRELNMKSFDEYETPEYKKFYEQLSLECDEAAKPFGEIRIISAFDTRPQDIWNYYTYYRLGRWGEASGCEMMGIARQGIKSIKKAIE